MKKLLLTLAIFGGLAVAAPAFAATTVHYDCVTFPLGNGDAATCLVDTWSKGAGFSLIDNQNGGGAPFFLMQVGTYYFSGTVTGSGTVFILRCNGVTNCSATNLTAGVYVDEPLTINSGSNEKLYLNGAAAGSVIAPCMTDTIGGCAAAPPAAPLGWMQIFTLWGWW